MVSLAQLEYMPPRIELEGALFGCEAWPPELKVAEESYPEINNLVASEHAPDEILVNGSLRPARRQAWQGDIQTLAVAPEHRRTGLGRTLLRGLLAEASARGVGDVFLEVRADNDAAVALYESEGFEAIDRRVGYYQPDGVDAIVMRLQSLSPQPGWAVADE